MSLNYLGKQEPRKLGLLSHAIYFVCFGLLYLRHLSTNFDHFFVDSKAVVLSKVMYKYYFSLGNFCVTPVRQRDQYYQLCGYYVICCYQNND